MNEAHVRAVVSALAQVEEALDRIDAVVEGRESRGVFARVQNTYTQAERRRLGELASRIPARMETLRERFSAEPDVLNARRLIWSHCAVVSDYLEEVSGDGLFRYGQPDPIEARFATEKLREIQALLGELVQVGSGGASR